MNTITFEQAQQIAATDLERRRNAPRFSGYEFSPVQLFRDEGVSWIFLSGSQQLMNEGWIPGALFVTVDKRDGHIWTDDETEQYYTALAAQKKAQPVLQAA